MINVLPLGDRFNYLYPFFDNEIIDFVYSLPDEWRISGRIYKEMLIKFFPKYFNEIPWQKTGFPINSIQNEFQSKQNNELIVLFGASELGKIALETVKCHYGQVCFCDNDKCKWYTCVSGVKVIPPYKLKNLNYKKLLITSMYWKEIGVQLVEMGITNFDVFKKDYRDYDKWFRTPGVFEFVWGILLSSKCERRNYFNTSEVKKLLHNHMLGRIDAARDIGLLVTFELFCRRFIDDSNNFDSLDIPEN